MQGTLSDTGDKPVAVSAVRETLANVVRIQQARIITLERALALLPKDRATLPTTWQVEASQLPGHSRASAVRSPYSSPIHSALTQSSLSTRVQTCAKGTTASQEDLAHADCLALVLSPRVNVGRVATVLDGTMIMRKTANTRRDASTCTELLAQKHAATQVSPIKDDAMSCATNAELSGLHKDIAAAQARCAQLEQVNARLRDELAVSEQHGHQASQCAENIWHDVEAYQKRLEKERAGKDSELRRLRILMRFSELKKDSDQLGAAHEELQKVTQAYTVLQAAHETLKVRSAAQASAIEAVMQYVHNQHRHFSGKGATNASDETRRLGLDILHRVGRLCSEAGTTRARDTMARQTHDGGSTHDVQSGFVDRSGAGMCNSQPPRRSVPYSVSAQPQTINAHGEEEVDGVACCTNTVARGSRERRARTGKGRSTPTTVPVRSEGFARLRRSGSAFGATHNTAQGSALNCTRSMLFGQHAHAALTDESIHRAAVDHRRISSPRIAVAAGTHCL